jgi:hypothetical protein
MGESTLALSYRDYMRTDAYYIGWGRKASVADGLDQLQEDRCHELVNAGVRQFYEAYRWSFLRPTTTITVWPSIAVDSDVTLDGIHESNTNTTILRANTDSFYASMVGKSIVITDVGTFTIIKYVSATVLWVAGDATGSAKTFAITADGDYRLPDDFGSIHGDLRFGASEAYNPLPIVNEGRIRTQRQYDVGTDIPQIAAIQPLALDNTDSTLFEAFIVGQRWNLLVWPGAASTYTLSYRYNVLAQELNDDNPYPYGGAGHAETIKASCLAVAEAEENDIVGPKQQIYAQRLAASIARDRALAPETLGQIVENSDGADIRSRRDLLCADATYVTYNGVRY